MRNVLIKELKLSASPFTLFSVLFALMFFLPGYPVLCGAFFVTLGIFKSFESAREANDIVFSSLLPISKKDVVKGKYLFAVLIQLLSLALMAFAVLIRMTLLANAEAYLNNALMNANLATLGYAFLVFGMFNLIFIGGFFKTAYKLGKPFILYSVVSFLIIGTAEALHYFPKLSFLNSFGFENCTELLCILLACTFVYLLLTAVSYVNACKNFERIDL